MTGNDNSTSGSKRVARFTKDVLYAGIVDAVSKAVFYVGLAIVAAFALLIWRGGSVPAWSAALAVLLVIIAGLVLRRRLAGEVVRLGNTVTSLRTDTAALQARVDELEPLEDEVAKLRDDNERFQWGLDRHESYGAHVSEVLGHLQRVLSGDIPGVSIPDFIERGILAPARDLLASSAAEDVRLSILLPDGDYFYMRWAAGHSIESQQKYKVRKATSLSRLAFEGEVAYEWEDVHEDHRFEANPHATRDFHAMVSLPIRVGDEVVGVFNVISGEPRAFDTPDVNYITSLGSIIDVAVTVHLKAAGLTGDPDDAE